MNSCIFTAHCMESICDRSCPILVETSYLLERNGISLKSPVFSKYSDRIPSVMKMIDKMDSGGLASYDVNRNKGLDTVQMADLITYCAICRNWKGSQLHCTVYNLKFSKYIDEIKKSWNSNESETAEMMRIWAESAKFLVISNFDYVKFGDFECQTMLNLIQLRQSQGLKTVIVVAGNAHDQYIHSAGGMFGSVLNTKIDDSVVNKKTGGNS